MASPRKRYRVKFRDGQWCAEDPNGTAAKWFGPDRDANTRAHVYADRHNNKLRRAEKEASNGRR